MNDEVMDFFKKLAFEATEIEDGQIALAFEYSENGSYVLLTDEDGLPPESLKKRVLLAYYTSEGAFQWSAGFKDAHVFNDVWAGIGHQLDALLKYRASKEL